MATGSLLTLIDDIASVLDDVAVLSKIAAKKAAGVLGDDLALNAQQVSGVAGIGFSNALFPSRRHPGRHPEHGRTRAEHCARGADSPAGPAEKRPSRALSAGYPLPPDRIHRSRKPWRAADPRSPALRAA